MKWIERWYLSYALLGMSAAGLVPILFPLLEGRSGGPAHVGLVMASFSLGGITAPLWGGMADRFHLHRWLLVAGLLGTAAGALFYPSAGSFFLRIVSALAVGSGLAAASTVANLFIVEVRPKEEWDSRIGWLQSFYGGGQVIGLLLAGLIGQAAPEEGLRLAGVTAGIAVLPALAGTRRDAALIVQQRPVLARPPHRAEWPVGSPQHLYHHPSLHRLGKMLQSIRSPFGLFLFAWLLSFSGSAALFSFYPVLMQQLYGVLPGASSAAYAASAGLGLILYAPAGNWSAKRGPLIVFRIALIVRGIACVALIALTSVRFPGRGWITMLAFLVVVLAWSLLSVSGTALIASLASQHEGEGLGVFNAVTAFAGVIGSALGGWIAGSWGYGSVPVMGLVGVGSGLLITAIPVNAHRKKGSGEIYR